MSPPFQADAYARRAVYWLKVEVMYAVVRTGGKQYKVAPADLIRVEKLDAEVGSEITLGDVLLVGEGASITDGKSTPVKAEVVSQIRDDKIIIFKKKRRHNYRRRNGHRQYLTVLRITAIGDHRASERPVADAPPATA